MAHGLEDGPHLLRLERLAGRLEDFPEGLIYHPAGAKAGGGPVAVLRVLPGGDGTLLLSWPETPTWTLEHPRDWRTWTPLPAGTTRFGRREWAGAIETTAGFFRLWADPSPGVE